MITTVPEALLRPNASAKRSSSGCGDESLALSKANSLPACSVMRCGGGGGGAQRGEGEPVWMTGPAIRVFEGEIDLERL